MKYIVIILIIIVLIVAGAGYLYYSNTQSHNEMFSDISQFDSYLRNKEYDKAKSAYERANNTLKANYNITLDTYASQYLTSIAEDGNPEDILNDLYAIQEVGYISEDIGRMIKHYEDIMQSNYAFETGLELYRENKYDEAIEVLSNVVEGDENCEAAMQIIEDYYKHEQVFEEAKESNLLGRNPKPNAVAVDEEHMYIPYINDNAYCILKINNGSYLTHVFPIISTDYVSDIGNMNIIGEYIYFTLNASNTTDADYSGIYKIKTDGSVLQKLSDDKMNHLLLYGDKFYGVSYAGDLRVYDSRFMDYDILFEGDIVSMQMTEDGIYMGVAESDENNADIPYVKWDFDKEKIIEIESNDNKNRFYQVYDAGNIVCFDYSKNFEWLYLVKRDHSNQYINVADIADVYGMIDKMVLYTVLGDYYQECINVFDISKDNNIELVPTDTFFNVPIGICYETSTILSVRNNEIYVSGIDFVLDSPVVVPSSNEEMLLSNENTIFDFGINENAVLNESMWSYSDDGIDISINNDYMEDIESDVYTIEIISDDVDVLDIMTKDEVKPDDVAFAVSVDIETYEDADENSDVTLASNVITSDGMIIDMDGTMQLFTVEKLVTKDIYTYDNVDVAIETGHVVLDDYALMETVSAEDNYIGIGIVKEGHYIIITSDNTDDDNKALTPYQCGKLLSEMGCSNGFCYDNDNISLYLNGEIIFDNGLSMTEDGRYLIID